MRKSHLGKRNSQESINQMKAKIKAMIWIYRGTEESRILKKDLKSRELEGWKIGRNPESRSKISNSLKTFNRKNILKYFLDSFLYIGGICESAHFEVL